MVVLEETFVVPQSLICEREDISELECLMVSAVIPLNVYGVLSGWRKSRGKRKGKLVFFDQTDRIVTVLVRKVSGPHLEKSKIAWKQVSRWVATGAYKMFNDFDQVQFYDMDMLVWFGGNVLRCP